MSHYMKNKNKGICYICTMCLRGGLTNQVIQRNLELQMTIGTPTFGFYTKWNLRLVPAW